MNVMTENTRIIGLDVGDKRIGVAVSAGIIASPLKTVHRKNTKDDLERIAALVKTEEAGSVVIGLPKNMDGSEGEQAQKTRSFADKLARLCAVPVCFQDERLSTFTATEMLAQQGIKTGHNRDLVDMQAAAIILQAYLDNR